MTYSSFKHIRRGPPRRAHEGKRGGWVTGKISEGGGSGGNELKCGYVKGEAELETDDKGEGGGYGNDAGNKDG